MFYEFRRRVKVERGLVPRAFVEMMLVVVTCVSWLPISAIAATGSVRTACRSVGSGDERRTRFVRQGGFPLLSFPVDDGGSNRVGYVDLRVRNRQLI